MDSFPDYEVEPMWVMPNLRTYLMKLVGYGRNEPVAQASAICHGGSGCSVKNEHFLTEGGCQGITPLGEATLVVLNDRSSEGLLTQALCGVGEEIAKL